MAKGSEIGATFALNIFTYTIFPNIPELKSMENNFEIGFCSLLDKVYRYQAMNRDIWKRMFESRYKSCGFKNVKQIFVFLRSTLILFENTAIKMIAELVIGSLALVNELNLFLYYNKCGLFLKELANFWGNYFFTLKEVVGKDDLSIILFYTEEKVEEHVSYVESFLLTPYVPVEKAVIAEKLCSNCSEGNSTPCSTELISKEPFETSEITSTKSLINTGLGIRPHEELLLEIYGISSNIGKPPKKCNMSSLDDRASLVSSKENPILFRTSTLSHQEQRKKPRGSPGSPAVTSRLEQKRQKMRAVYAKRIQQKIEQMKLAST